MAYFLFLAVVSGIVLPIQSGINAQLRVGLGSPILAAAVSFVVGTAALAGLVALGRVPVPAGAALTRIPWWWWTGGLLGAFYVAATIVATRPLGAATLTGTVVAGQMIASLVLDQYGMVGYTPHAADGWRILGAGLVVLGVVLIQRN